MGCGKMIERNGMSHGVKCLLTYDVMPELVQTIGKAGLNNGQDN